MVRKRGRPESGELVVCTVTKINPHSAFARLEEYGAEGMVHISEVSSGWVKDIRKFIREGELVVAKVLRAEPLSLSLKRVDRSQNNSKMKDYRLNQRAERMLELAGKQLGRTLEQAYREVGFLLQESFGSLYEGFRQAMQNADALRSRGVPEDWIAPLKAIAEKNIEAKEFTFRARLFARSFSPDGINKIKSLLAEAQNQKLSVHYIAAPEYLVKYATKNAKKGEKEFEAKLSALTAFDKALDVKFERV